MHKFDKKDARKKLFAYIRMQETPASTPFSTFSSKTFGTFGKTPYICNRKQYNQVVKMNSSQTYIDIIRKHQPELQERFGITSMRLFGSVARGDHHPGSDIDLFVTMPPKLYNYIEAAQYLEQLLGCSVDLIRNHQYLRPFFRQQIERDGIDIFTAA